MTLATLCQPNNVFNGCPKKSDQNAYLCLNNRQAKLAFILHADVVSSTALGQRDGRQTHERITSAFRRF